MYLKGIKACCALSPTLENWPLFGENFWTIGQIMQLHSHWGSVYAATVHVCG